jgi:fucose 4-O-acetylase-like acetyltransferase
METSTNPEDPAHEAGFFAARITLATRGDSLKYPNGESKEETIMAKLTIGFGVLLIVLGIFGFVATGSAYPTALIPTALGLLFVLFGVMANTEDSKKRMLWMHISVTLALLVFLGMIPAAIDVIRLAHGVFFPYPAAVEEKAALGLFSLIYVLFCVRSFINARRGRLA